MGAGESKECSTCHKETKAAIECFKCKKIVCMNHSVKADYSNSGRVRLCITCKANSSNDDTNGTSDEPKLKVKGFQKMINVTHDSKTGTYSGLPTLWRDLLDMPVSKSKNEVDTSGFDSSVAPAQPSKRILYEIKEKNSEGAYIISAPQTAEKTFQVRYDPKQGKLVGAPEHLQKYLEGFKKEDLENNPEAVMMAADKARQMEEDRENNVVELPSEE